MTLMMFTSVSSLIFSQIPKFLDTEYVVINYLESSLGTWDLSIYSQRNIYGEPLSFITHFGQFYHLIFLFTNLVLMLNFVIAILSETYAQFENLKNGLYYNELV